MQATAVAIHALENVRTHYIIFNEQNLMQSPEPTLPLRSIFLYLGKGNSQLLECPPIIFMNLCR